MGIVKEFKEFAVKGNMVDMAVGIIIGAAFGKVVSSLVADVAMPPLGLAIGGVNFTGLKAPLRGAVDGKEAVTLNYGNFLQTMVDFLIVAFVVFLVIKAINRMKRKEEAKPAAPPVATRDQILLTEIRDLLKAR